VSKVFNCEVGNKKTVDGNSTNVTLKVSNKTKTLNSFENLEILQKYLKTNNT
jgi:hypothetical protein